MIEETAATRRVGDALEQVAQLSQLQTVSLTGSQVTSEGIQWLQTRLPDIYINWEPGWDREDVQRSWDGEQS